MNVLKANVAARSASTVESSPKGMWIQSWNDPQQTFAWKVQIPKADKYSVDVLVSGAPGSPDRDRRPARHDQSHHSRGQRSLGEQLEQAFCSWLAELATGNVHGHGPQPKPGRDRHEQEPLQGHGADVAGTDCAK